MTRRECLEQAAKCVLRDRQKQYGEPEDCFETIAMMWSAYLGKTIQGWDVAAMMALLKVARIKSNPAHDDNWCDLAGYAACGAECRQKFEAEMKKTVEDAFETFPYLKPEAEGVCCQNGKDRANPLSFEEQAKAFARENPPEEPRFEHGDRVQAFNGEEWVDCRYIRWDGSEGRHVVHYKGCRCSIDPVSLRPMPKAEGCEELVQNEAEECRDCDGFQDSSIPEGCEGCMKTLEADAPQTPHDLYKRIIDANPATFKARTPTGEELAEMAEEEDRG